MKARIYQGIVDKTVERYDMLILGCDIGSEIHYARAIDTRGRELSKSAFSFSNTKEGFESARDWAVQLAAINDKKQIVLGLEPTGHYWFCLATWMITNGISVVQVNPYAVKQTKEVEDNSQLIPIFSYSVQDTMTVHHFWLCFMR